MACCEVVSVRMVLPMDMKNLMQWSAQVPLEDRQPVHSYPKVAPDPSIYCPSVLITPFGPAPYLIMLTDPTMIDVRAVARKRRSCCPYQK